MDKKKQNGKYLFRVILVQALVMLVFVGVLFAIKQINKDDYKQIANEYLNVADTVDVEQSAKKAWNSLKAVLIKDNDGESGKGGKDEKTDGKKYPENCTSDEYVLSSEAVYPVKNGSVSCKYGFRKHPITKELSFHTGLDIAADSGDDIYSCFDGEVSEVGKSPAYGKYLYISHGNGIMTFYAHCSKILVEEGEVVRGGDKVALVGSTGWSTGPHLHLGMKINGIWYNPSYAFK